MKIAILTLQLNTNYGGILQCYALQTVLERQGHEVRVLTKPKYGRSYCIIYPLSVCKRIFKRYILGENIFIFTPHHEIICKKLHIFIKKYIHQYTRRNWTSKMAKDFDVIVVGSDQVWRPIYYQPIEEAFLSFFENVTIKRIAYAASFGLDNCKEYTQEQIKVCSVLLKKFDAVSVRESSGVNLCKNYFDVDAVQMLDPTLLLSITDYRYLINNAKTQPSKGNLLVYIIDKTKEKLALVNRIAEDKGLIPFWLDCPEIKLTDKKEKMSIEQWLRSFDDADFVFTDSFHGCVFSIIFKKQFIVIGNKERGLSRYISLLNLFSLNDRLILSSDEYSNNLLSINYDDLSEKLNLLQEHSLSFLSTLNIN